MYEKFTESKQYISLLLKGMSGTGKTTIAAQFPKPVLINFDKNTACLNRLSKESLDDLRLVDPFKDAAGKIVPNIKIWNNFTNQLSKIVEDNSVKTIIIDSLTLLAAALESSILGSDDPSKQFKIQDWGTFGRYLQWLGENLIQAQGRDKHIIVIAHEQALVDDDSGRTTGYSLAIGGKMKNSFEMYFSDVWKTFIETKVGRPSEYKVTGKPTNMFTAKCSLDLPDTWKFSEQKDSIIKQLA